MNDKVNLNANKALAATFLALLLVAFATDAASAYCPACAAAAAGGTVLGRWLGLGDLAIGVWEGVLVFSLALWLTKFLKRRVEFLNFKRGGVLEALNCSLMFLIFVSTFYLTGMMEGAEYLFWLVDKLVLGMFAGVVLAWAGMSISGWIKDENGGEVRIPFQSTVIVLGTALLASGALEVFL
ncbi:hypothetical protein AKJ45_01080 [candidate division MSBL1 archaeon SCGC-AAA261F19]|uniref:Uncharacterized protein n=2 Tax=candidate division MSBL1 TaxID=215777 RepID=A0A133VB13_9EURY|nr:hypothetical protein AKJ43_01270 [candidate division MSBL1 archaeon SCGC-AAA261D19]KXB03629.1 hypothetical protein AKJ45_01080 [candidate division MSBL1 archaeon SCGC-AAA261F19]